MEDVLLSKASLTGFEILQNPENGFYYFQFSDQQGRVILRSKDYQAAQTVETRMKATLKLARQVDNIQSQTDEGRFFFIVSNRNNQEMARSALFDAEEDMQDAIACLQEQAISEASTEKRKTAAAREERQSFRIDIYAHDEGEQVNGRIVHLLSEETKSFQGLNGDAIVRFISQYFESKPHSGAEKASLHLVAADGRPVQAVVFGEPLLHFMLSDPGGSLPRGKSFALKISARTLDGAFKTTLESDAKIDEDGAARIDLPGNLFSPGLYRLEAGLSPNGESVKGTCLFQVF